MEFYLSVYSCVLNAQGKKVGTDRIFPYPVNIHEFTDYIKSHIPEYFTMCQENGIFAYHFLPRIE